MRTGKLGGVAPFLDGEALRAVAPIQLTEAVHWNAGSSRHKLQETRPQLIGQ